MDEEEEEQQQQEEENRPGPLLPTSNSKSMSLPASGWLKSRTMPWLSRPMTCAVDPSTIFTLSPT